MPGGRLGTPGLACDEGAVESGFGSIGPAALHTGFLARGVDLTAQLDELLPEPAVLFLVTGTQVVDPLLTVDLFAFGVVNRGVALGGHRRQLPVQMADLLTELRRSPFGLRQVQT